MKNRQVKKPVVFVFYINDNMLQITEVIDLPMYLNGFANFAS